MTCYYPLQAYQSLAGDVFFSELRRQDSWRSLQLPCGQCIGCRLERSRQWAVRCLHEASLYERNCFITLTYAVAPVSLRYRDFQLFMKRLRKVASSKVRFFMCGEYGEVGGRCHFHACLFNYDLPDKEFFFKTETGCIIYTSPLLSVLWPHGHSSVGSLTFESAAYVARYVMKKVTGDGADSYYRVIDEETGQITDRVPEFCHMSLKPGIGAGWFDKFSSDVYPDGLVVMNGAQMRPPKYYDRRFKKLNDDGFAGVAMRRDALMRRRFEDNSDERLRVKEVVTRARLSSLKRKI